MHKWDFVKWVIFQFIVLQFIHKLFVLTSASITSHELHSRNEIVVPTSSKIKSNDVNSLPQISTVSGELIGSMFHFEVTKRITCDTGYPILYKLSPSIHNCTTSDLISNIGRADCVSRAQDMIVGTSSSLDVTLVSSYNIIAVCNDTNIFSSYLSELVVVYLNASTPSPVLHLTSNIWKNEEISVPLSCSALSCTCFYIIHSSETISSDMVPDITGAGSNGTKSMPCTSTMEIRFLERGQFTLRVVAVSDTFSSPSSVVIATLFRYEDEIIPLVKIPDGPLKSPIPLTVVTKNTITKFKILYNLYSDSYAISYAKTVDWTKETTVAPHSSHTISTQWKTNSTIILYFLPEDAYVVPSGPVNYVIYRLSFETYSNLSFWYVLFGLAIAVCMLITCVLFVILGYLFIGGTLVTAKVLFHKKNDEFLLLSTDSSHILSSESNASTESLSVSFEDLRLPAISSDVETENINFQI